MKRLYHPCLVGVAVLVLLVAGCMPRETTPAPVAVQVTADGRTLELLATYGSTVQTALEQAEITLGPLDRVEPDPLTRLTKDTAVQVVRVVEEFEVVQETIPFFLQQQPTELLPEGETRKDPLQPGEAGLREDTYRVIYEDGVEVSRSQVKSIVVQEPKPQIMLVGVRPLLSPTSIPGRLVYLVGGNAWVMEGTTGNRRPLITTGDLDGRVLSLSEDASWLLFTRRTENPGQVNGLWAADISTEIIELLDLKVPNVIHFSDWVPGSNNRVVYSTAEPRLAHPGWQANNDLNYMTVYNSGPGSFTSVEFTRGLDGSDDWWGIRFFWSPDGRRLAYSKLNEVGVVGPTREETPQPLLKFDPLLTRSDWSWVPEVSWGPDGRVLYTVEHVALPGSPTPGESQLFDLVAVPVEGGSTVRLVSNVGMFASPTASPAQPASDGETAYQVAYLQALFPTRSEGSLYRLMVMDRDGSDRRALFPPEGEPGLEPQKLAWSPDKLSPEGGFGIAVVYQGNLWLVAAENGQIQQITGEELVSQVVWKGN